VNDPPLQDANFTFPENYEYCSLLEISKNADIISNHVPLTFQGKPHPTYMLFDTELINSIKPKSLLLHASRGGIIDETALLARLKSSTMFASVDVWQDEPNFNGELAKLCLIATPHIAGYSIDGKIRGSLAMAQAYEKYFSNKPDYSEINGVLGKYSPCPIEKFNDSQEIFTLLSKNRRLEDDFEAFLAIADLPEQAKLKAFDQQRKNYPERRESL
jgi:erythronate-4-phosphate dehydrogenase